MNSRKFVVLGDFNIDVIDVESPKTKRFADLLRSHDLDWLIDSPTRVTDSSEIAIDIVITNLADIGVCDQYSCLRPLRPTGPLSMVMSQHGLKLTNLLLAQETGRVPVSAVNMTGAASLPNGNSTGKPKLNARALPALLYRPPTGLSVLQFILNKVGAKMFFLLLLLDLRGSGFMERCQILYVDEGQF
ncbi:hypothetical protein J6590_087749 [Homalodisca vitripennis]|nr:hypothetical protein J6590_087749 [Homalodisca vitripennis]